MQLSFNIPLGYPSLKGFSWRKAPFTFRRIRMSRASVKIIGRHTPQLVIMMPLASSSKHLSQPLKTPGLSSTVSSMILDPPYQVGNKEHQNYAKKGA